LPRSWRFAQQVAAELARELEHLAWAARVEALDGFFLRQAETLHAHGVIRLISHDPPAVEVMGSESPEKRAARFTTWTRAILGAVLIELDEPEEVGNVHQAVTYLLGGDLRRARAVAFWTERHGTQPVADLLSALPGCSLVFLAATQRDGDARCKAQDVFWAAANKPS
jgi:hypothetical protein